MKYAPRLRAIATMPLITLCASCVSTVIPNAVPPCDRMIPPSLLERTPDADQPVSAKLPDGHDDARPWQAGFIEQTGQKEISDAKPGAIHHIYRECLSLHREAQERSRPKFLGIF